MIYDLVSAKVGIEVTAARILPCSIPLLLEPRLDVQQVHSTVIMLH